MTALGITIFGARNSFAGPLVESDVVLGSSVLGTASADDDERDPWAGVSVEYSDEPLAAHGGARFWEHGR